MANVDPEYIALLNKVIDLLTDSHNLIKEQANENKNRLDKIESQLTRVK
jgi:hypothetical protein